MFTQKIMGLAPATGPSDAVRFDQLPAVNPGDEIVNASGNSYVKVNTDESITLTSNTNEVVSIQPTQVVVSQPIFSTTTSAFDPSNQLLTKSQLDPYYMPIGTRLNEIPYPEGNVTMNGF
jgi:hypothetical protein